MEYINSLLWSVASLFLILCGLYYSFKLKGLHLNFKDILGSFKNKKGEKGISPFQSLTMALGARIGVGSLAGIALAIFNGGVGTVFWIWISCIINAPNSLVESALAVLYHQKDGDYYEGGPSYYIKNGLGKHKLAIIYAVIVTISYLLGFLSIQSNTITKSFSSFFSIHPIVIGIVIGLLSFMIIFKGIKSIAKFTSFFVPVMGLGYLAVCIIIMSTNLDKIPTIFSSIMSNAFNVKAMGWGLLSTIIIGLQRGIFSSEAGIGTGAIASGSADTREPIKQGLVQTFGIYFTTFIICTSTAIIILTSNYNPLQYVDVNGIEITQNALIYHLGHFGNIVLTLSIITFAFSTIISGYYYGEANIKFLSHKVSDRGLLILKVITCLILVLGSVINSTFLWGMVDIFVAILAIINIYAIFILRKDVIWEYQKYKRSK